MAYILTLILISVFTVICLGVFVGLLFTGKIGIISFIVIGCLILILVKVAYDKFTNREDNYYDNHVNK